jgi:hypothetical protein
VSPLGIYAKIFQPVPICFGSNYSPDHCLNPNLSKSRGKKPINYFRNYEPVNHMRWLLIRLVRGYQFFLSPWLGSNCRFNPSCSNYAIDAIEQWGAIKGSWLAIKRIGKCHPWGDGGNDPVPPNRNRNP